ncbi:hypothetical protein MJO28_015107 [Puccinia striiformis f. sp. tritici]|nr:hypothetical protein Pst134EA_027950 [Puccinia striiformis f. sp. tritici]KAI9607927.1 hypothetical protein H4Q26_005377 [Puccinia striiformis f. sp. tritici PST-130]KNE90454.1 hypothetical protein PSTG_16119 [Puccinia striiformis f. sp. tritici PST-78]POW22037.1 hypothetical protein PSHT_01773 [Puccinia striiformis]KAH9442234.1 hypothetical protein Pst134EB_028488 [Puccinia striiformis f. sp. tritici]KAH9448653.1 hypothetical protein Pst134EA_027950 [Puccinia striiformis f. sp. tritici]
MTTTITTKEQLRSSTVEFQESQTQLKRLISSRQTLDSQLTENQSVKEQIDQLKPADKPIIFKSIANVLIKQDLKESQSNINRRIEFLKHEQTKVDKKIESIQAKMDSLRPIINELTAKVQQEAPTQQLAQTHLAKPTAAV